MPMSSPARTLISGTTALSLLGLSFASFAPNTQAQTPWLGLSSYSGLPSNLFGVSGWGYTPNEQVTVKLDGSSTTVTTDASGSFHNAPLSTPSQPAGTYQVQAKGQTSGSTSTATYYIAGYYPTGGPSSYYLLPGQMLGFTGKGFAPNEMVSLSGSGQAMGFSTDSLGSFSTTNSITIPYSAAGSTLNYQLRGQTSKASVNFMVTIGRYYPQTSPSTYYLSKGGTLSVNGTNFAPGEPVHLMLNGSQVADMSADNSGNVTFGSVTAPASGSTFTVTLTGAWITESSSRMITLAQ